LGRFQPVTTGRKRSEAVLYSPEKSETQAGMGYRSDLETDLYSWRKNCGFTFLVLRVHDNPKFSGRNRAWHEAWITEQTATVLRFDGMNSAEKMAAKVTHALS
jgi:hypothetical protein